MSDAPPPDETRLDAGEQRLRSLGQLAAGVAHDLNQSLALISGYGELAQQVLAQSTPDLDSLDEYVGIMRQAAVDSGETVQRLLTFARGGEIGPAQPITVPGLLREVAALTAPRWRDQSEAEGRPIHMELQAAGPDEELMILGWAATLREALTNLIFNAVDALPRGGVIRLTCRRRADEVEIEVGDDGLGMSAEVRQRIFEPFFTTKGEQGTGLGLPHVLSVVRRHGGHVEVRSAPGRGTVCRLSLPAAAVGTSTARRAGSVSVLPDRRLRILVVEDIPALSRLLSRIIERRGHKVVTVSSAEMAIEQLEGFHFDLVISDLGLGPGMNGWELAEHVRTHWPGLAFGLATGWGATIDPSDAQQRGVFGVLTKPFTSREVASFLEQMERSTDPGPQPPASRATEPPDPGEPPGSPTATLRQSASTDRRGPGRAGDIIPTPRRIPLPGLIARSRIGGGWLTT